MIKITVNYDWEAAKAAVSEEQLAYRIEQVSTYAKEGMDYLSTHYYDATEYRFWDFELLVETGYIEAAKDAMIKLMEVWLAQKEVFGEIEANNAFEEYKVGNHDT